MTDEQLERYFQALQSDITSLRRDMHGGFADVRGEVATLRRDMDSGFADVRAEVASLRRDMDSDFADVRAEMADMRSEMATKSELAALRDEVRAGFRSLEERLSAVEGP